MSIRAFVGEIVKKDGTGQVSTALDEAVVSSQVEGVLSLVGAFRLTI